MPDVSRSPFIRVAAVIVVYLVLVAVAAAAFQFTRESSSGVHLHYVIYGPALALFTHMSYALFALQTLFVVPWLLWYAANSRYRGAAILGFCATWIAIGWYMYKLF
jgi:hypothetical protein